MNLKGMETSNQNHMILSRLQVFAIILLVIFRTSEPNNDGQLFRKTSTSVCWTFPVVATEYTSSVTECSVRCMMNDKCDYFSYCNGPCKMHKLLYSDELGNAACNCLSFIRFSGSSSGWQKIFVFNKTSVDKSPIYKDWEILPIDKVKVIMRKDNMDVKSLTFDGRGTNYTSWFNESNLIEEPWFGNLTVIYRFKDDFSQIHIRVSGTPWYAMRAQVLNDTTYNILYREDPTVGSSKAVLETVDIYILLQQSSNN